MYRFLVRGIPSVWRLMVEWVGEDEWRILVIDYARNDINARDDITACPFYPITHDTSSHGRNERSKHRSNETGAAQNYTDRAGSAVIGPGAHTFTGVYFALTVSTGHEAYFHPSKFTHLPLLSPRIAVRHLRQDCRIP